ncbi:MAG: hypothetical protein M1436_04160, partial [Acidobacteria bacterium]|nr:hypothetical protein [Acidobacteriota bacterium]
MPRLLLPVLIALAIAPLPAAEKKPVTIEAVTSAPSARAGPGTAIWAPDGKRFAYTEQRALWLYDVASGQKRQLINLSQLADKAVKYARPERFGWENRGVAEQNIQWAASGNELLLSSGGDLF